MCTPNKIISEIFTPFQAHVDAEQDIREEIKAIVKRIEAHQREILIILQVIHHDPKAEQLHAACLSAREIFEKIRKGFDELDNLIPPGEFYRYNDHWKYTTQRMCFLAALIIFLEKGILISKDTTAEILGVHQRNNLHLDLDEYLMGLLNLASELARFAVNAVTFGDYNRPLEISRFVAQLNAGFRLLNLKNDSLRKRFDALKYDVKKIEEIVYDLSIRGLIQNNNAIEEVPSVPTV